jgi:conflict system pore-forming effector with SLATT domain
MPQSYPLTSPPTAPVDDHPPKASKTRSIAFWIIVVLTLIFWLIAWLVAKCGPWSHLLLVAAVLAALTEILSGKEERNLLANAKPMPNWDPLWPEESLAEIYLYVIREAANSAGWYWKYKTSKSLWSRIIRFLVWALAGVAGLLPVVGALLAASKKTLLGVSFSSGLWASLLLGIAGALLGLDKGFGFSSAWARYVLTATNISKSLEEFRLDWTLLRAKAGSPLTTIQQVTPLIERAKQFRAEAESLVLQETKDWVTEFQSTMAQLEKDVSAQISELKAQVDKTRQEQEAASKGGALQVTVQNMHKVVAGTLRIVVIDNTNKTIFDEALASNTWSKFLSPGFYLVSLEAMLTSPPMGGLPPPQPVTIKSGAPESVNFVL